MLPDEVIENADLLDLAQLKTAILEDESIPDSFKNKVDELLFEYKHFLAIKVVFFDTGRPMISSPSNIIHQVWLHHLKFPANYSKCCRQLGVEIIDYDSSMCKDSLQDRQKKLEMTKSRYKILFPTRYNLLFPNTFWEDFYPAGATIENGPKSGIPQSELKNNIKVEDPAVGLNQIKTEPGTTEVNGENPVKVVTNFASSGLNSILQENIKRSGYFIPTPIQKNCLPFIMTGRDVMACAHTGSGKTAAYLLPIIHKIMESGVMEKEGSAPQIEQCLVIVPTRELALQIKAEVLKLTAGSSIQTCTIYGGNSTSVGILSQQEANSYDILIGTPRRLLLFVNRGWVRVENLKFIVLDEADKLMATDFKSCIEDLLNRGNKDKRQTLMFSRTCPDEVVRFGGELLKNYKFVTVSVTVRACSVVPQEFYDVSKLKKRDKLDKLKEMLHNCNNIDKVIIFVGTKIEANSLTTNINVSGFPAACLHGDLLQDTAAMVLSAFRSGHVRILVSTLIIRGLDINQVTRVINFDMPQNVDEYIYRIGFIFHRGTPGKATSFFDRDQDTAVAGDLGRILNDCGQVVPPWLAHTGDKPVKQEFQESVIASTRKRKFEDDDNEDNRKYVMKGVGGESAECIRGSYNQDNSRIGGNQTEISRVRKPERNHFNLPPSKENDCYFYVFDHCYKGPNCPYRHEPTALKNETVCKYWKAGKCLRLKCPFRHFEKENMRNCYWEKKRGECNQMDCPFRHHSKLHAQEY